MREIEIHYRYSTKSDGHYEEDNPEADYPNEVYIEGRWTHYLMKDVIPFKKISHAFDEEDGDEDFSKQIMLITNAHDHEILFDMTSIKTMEERKRIEEHLRAQAQYWVD